MKQVVDLRIILLTYPVRFGSNILVCLFMICLGNLLSGLSVHLSGRLSRVGLCSVAQNWSYQPPYPASCIVSKQVRLDKQMLAMSSIVLALILPGGALL